MNRAFVHLFLISALAVIAYSNTFDAAFQFDDKMYVTENPLIRDSRFLLDPEASDRLNLIVDVRTTRITRLLGYVSFFFNYSASGLEAAGYHAVNIAIHVANGMLVYLLVALTFGTPFMERSRLKGSSRYVALLSAALFVAHPVQTQAVTYISQRFTSLAAMFYLLALCSYAASRLSASGMRRVALYAVSLLAAACAMTSKEIAFTLPVSVAMYEFMFLEGTAKRRAAFLLPMFLTMLIIPLGRLELGGSLGAALLEATRTAPGLTREEYLLTQFRVLATYFRLLAFPVNQNLDYDYPVVSSLSSAGAVGSLVLILVLLGGALWLLRLSRGRAPELRLVSFGVLWLFVTLSVESSFIVLADIIFEHRLYLPLAGAFPALAVGLSLAAGRMEGPGRKAALAMMVALPLLLATAAHARNGVWKTDVSLWSDVVEKSPRKARGYNNLGKSYWSRRQTGEAMEMYQAALGLQPGYSMAHNNIGVLYGYLGQDERAMRHFEAAVTFDPDNVEARFNLGVKYLEMGMKESARREFEAVLRVMPYHVQSRQFLSYLNKSD